MAKDLALTPVSAIAIPSLVWGGNYLAGAYGGYPFLYCWLNGPVSTFYLDWGKLALYGILIYTAIQLWRLKLFEALVACSSFVAII